MRNAKGVKDGIQLGDVEGDLIKNEDDNEHDDNEDEDDVLKKILAVETSLGNFRLVNEREMRGIRDDFM